MRRPVGRRARAPGARALEQLPLTLLHGDAKLENLGLGADGPVLIDWGDLTGFGPIEVDVAWYALKGGARIEADVGDLFADYEAVSGRRLDPRALDLVCLGSLAQMGFRMAASARHGETTTAPPPCAAAAAPRPAGAVAVRSLGALDRTPLSALTPRPAPRPAPRPPPPSPAGVTRSNCVAHAVSAR